MRGRLKLEQEGRTKTKKCDKAPPSFAGGCGGLFGATDVTGNTGGISRWYIDKYQDRKLDLS
ncbi:MAG TPA: hypothetical protein VEW05_05060 [Candidatus Polarisedimenticolia bacterium]|nr:hypothetical protein [Candidatus Polarisedimenticolia bacterium]